MTLTRHTPLRRSRMVRHSRSDQPPASAVMAAVGRAWRPQGVCCEICTIPVHGERGVGWSLHHRRGRDGRPGSHFVENLLVVCGASNVDGCHGVIHGCHGVIHGRRGEAERNGWWISRNASPAIDPLSVPVLIEHGSRWVYFTADGGYSDNPPETP